MAWLISEQNLPVVAKQAPFKPGNLMDLAYTVEKLSDGELIVAWYYIIIILVVAW